MKHIAIYITLFIAAILFAIAAHSDGFKYDPSGRRDPFVPLVGAEKPVNAGLENIGAVEDIKLEGIAISPKGKSRAILNGEMVKENDRFGNLTVKKIEKKRVIIIFSGTEHILALPEEGGITGEK